MKIMVAAVGRQRRSPEQTLVQDYKTRFEGLGRGLGLKSLEIIEVEEPSGVHGPALKAREGERLLRAVPAGSRMVALDERGTVLASTALAERLGQWRDGGSPVCAFLIGGADGLDPGVREKADLCLSFGAATWPHMLVRAMLCEQIYRAATILAGHPYHRA